MTREEEIANRLLDVEERIAGAAHRAGRKREEIELIVVTKNFPQTDAQILYRLGIRAFGENRDQEGALKSEQLPGDIAWHFQGQIQGRKIKSIASWADSVHSLDSLDHALKFASVGESRVQNFFIQVNLEPERADRGGVRAEDLESLVEAVKMEAEIFPIGLMTVAPNGLEPERAFAQMSAIHKRVLNSFPTMTALSMGMSGDFEAAIAAGATHLRIGSSILGSRELPA